MGKTALGKVSFVWTLSALSFASPLADATPIAKPVAGIVVQILQWSLPVAIRGKPPGRRFDLRSTGGPGRYGPRFGELCGGTLPWSGLPEGPVSTRGPDAD